MVRSSYESALKSEWGLDFLGTIAWLGIGESASCFHMSYSFFMFLFCIHLCSLYFFEMKKKEQTNIKIHQDPSTTINNS